MDAAPAPRGVGDVDSKVAVTRCASLFRCVFLIDVFTCPQCRGPQTLLAVICDMESILGHLDSPLSHGGSRQRGLRQCSGCRG